MVRLQKNSYLIVLLNIIFPIALWLGLRTIARRLNQKHLKIYLIFLIISLAVFGVPQLFDYKFNNWIIEYLSVPILASLVATMISFPFWTREKGKYTFWIYFIALVLNGGFQGLSFHGRAMNGYGYPSHYLPNPQWTVDGFNISEVYSQGFAGPPYRQFVIHNTLLNGLLYKEVVRTTENDTTKCEIIFYRNLGAEKYIFDRCEESLRLE